MTATLSEAKIDNTTWNSLSLTKAIAHIKAKDFTAEELLAESVRRIAIDDEKQNKINAITQLHAEKAKATINKNIGTNETSKLAGVPLVIKSNINVKGLPLDCCSKILEGYVAPYDATMVEKVLNAGGVFFASANMDEFAMGSSNENSIYGAVRNPVNREYIPGGSSGGAAASVASGQALAAFGTDTGGSVRQPASLCGVVGLKPTYGRVSRYGAVAFASSFDQIGPITRTVEDAALLLSIIAGHDHRDSTTLQTPVEDFTVGLNDSIRGLKLAMPKEYFTKEVHPDILVAMQNVQKFYENAGVEIKHVSIPETNLGIPVYYVLACAEASANLSRFDGIRYGRRTEKAKNLEDVYNYSRSEGFGAEVKRRILIGNYVLSSGFYDAYYRKAQSLRQIVQQEYIQALTGCDAIFTPTVPYIGKKLGEFAKEYDPLKEYHRDIFTVGANVAGVPAISIPCGVDSLGLPIGFQLLGRPLQEQKLFQLGAAYEKENPLQCWNNIDVKQAGQ